MSCFSRAEGQAWHRGLRPYCCACPFGAASEGPVISLFSTLLHQLLREKKRSQFKPPISKWNRKTWAVLAERMGRPDSEVYIPIVVPVLWALPLNTIPYLCLLFYLCQVMYFRSYWEKRKGHSLNHRSVKGIESWTISPDWQYRQQGSHPYCCACRYNLILSLVMSILGFTSVTREHKVTGPCTY